jgi:hypothetical protein
LRCFQLAGVPARRLLPGVLHQPFEDADVVLHVGLDEADQRAGFVAQLAQHRVDDLDVGAVAVDEDDAVEAVVDQAAAHVVDQVQQVLLRSVIVPRPEPGAYICCGE